MSAQARPFITCHVLETVSGRPAANMHVRLSLISPQRSTLSTSTSFAAVTNSDGRVTEWRSTQEGGTITSSELNHLVEMVKSDLMGDDQMVWSLKFATGDFYGVGKTFWPEVELRFFTRKDERHYHVPLLLGPWSYTTYRGS